ncbi:YjdF family protein [Clostridium sp. HCP1S3_B4]|uniref:YjdF family protein n=1 Tax=unclassified Clostridium TaxID=2614128 RepID=UPI001696A88D|nr:YjdF family protein [Clostridiales bacterium]MDY2728996.1 YjdF family protein [Clostridium sp.]NLK23129.1 YjdF family protein [Clostridiales bacterium]
MDELNYIELNVLFNDPFWIGILEKREGDNYCACKITFGAEPKDYEVFDFLLKNYYKFKFSPKLKEKASALRTINPKRQQREIKKALKKNGEVGTKAQRALSLMHEENKLQRKIKSKAKREEEKEKKFNLKQEKRKQKHKGR